MLKECYPEFANNSVILELEQYMDYIQDASDDPDNFIWNELDSDVYREFFDTGQLWSSHYMDPYTGNTYSGEYYAPNWKPHISAGWMAKRYINLAATEWIRGNKQFAAYLLGYASHFIEDSANPHHASLDISTEDGDAIKEWMPDWYAPDEDTTHSEHEAWADKNFELLYNMYGIGVYDKGYSKSYK